jgi:hypothetical protein
MATADEIINGAAERVISMQDSMDSLGYTAINSIAGAEPYAVPVGVPRLRGQVPAFQGEVNITSELMAGYGDALRDLTPALTAAIADYIARWFPTCVVSATDNWICNTILYGGTGLPAHIENAIWQRGRARDIIEANRLEQEAYTALADRGFTQPTGATATRVLMIQQEASNKISQFNRDTAIKAAEIEIENIKFAVEQGVKIRIAVMQGLGDYIRAWYTPYGYAIDMAKARAESKGKFINSAADYYRAMISEAELELRADIATAEAQNEANKAWAQLTTSANQTKGQVAGGLAQAYGSAAAAAASSVLGSAGDTTVRVGAAAPN